MKKIGGFFLWSLIFVLLLAALDQALLRIDLDLPGYRETRQFYVGFRDRLFDRPAQRRTLTIEDVIEQAPPAAPAQKNSATGYVYVDEQGALHLVDSLEDVPPRLRREAKKLSR
ncbi:hypothetical protein SAMN05660860_01232 [Geoalkalibacter ferrihydriticus]|uniref:Uncharacterized protein n=2 Tax=Geoalkalibacter ferrihydriticus TaxID=392333 RepID=A0A0C2HSG4_9BACT|nr:hypothetical protein [Geoalkalibacter ferrihydriticus]KIH77745.1 hypothetical protein GFER_03580 [Geoalkalibacter ferrihydriticus DSM 17813]SDL76827.1 hypothetical protein SAMN05660860_01232 [Geoalkalibacter ferrihydriticus]